MPLYLYIARRLITIIPLLFGITIVSFVIARAVPADPINANLSQRSVSDPKIVEAFRKEWGLDKTPVEQYLTYVSNLLQGNLGKSIKTRQPLAADIARYLPATIELATTATVVGGLMGLILGIISAVWMNRPVDYLARTFSLIGVSIPVFLLALIGLAVLHAQLGWVSGPGRLDFALKPPPHVTGMYTIDSALAGQWDLFWNAVSHLVLPSLVLGSYTSGIISRVTRTSLAEVLSLDYIRTARSKGIREQFVILRHGLRNALVPVVTVVGLSYGSLLAGAVLTESIFAWPGIGRYMFRASTSQDFPAIMGISLLIAFIYVIVNLIVDVLYYILDPRIRAA